MNDGPFAELDAGLIHMTSTYQTSRGHFGVRCRCPWAAEGFASLATARNAGDAHLREANATCPTTPADPYCGAEMGEVREGECECPKCVTAPGHEASRRAEEPAITFGMDEGSQIVFRDQAALDEFVVGARLEGWVPLGTYNDVQLPSHLTFECSADVDDAGLPRWERITTRHAAPVQKGVWRHQDDGTPCVSYPDSFDWNWTEQPFTCSNHGRVMTCVLRPEAQQ